MPFGVQKREMSLRQPGLMREQQPLVNRWGRKNEALRTSISKVWVKKTASPRGAELARNHKSRWTVQECCLLVVRGLERPRTLWGSAEVYVVFLWSAKFAPDHSCLASEWIRKILVLKQERESKGRLSFLCIRGSKWIITMGEVSPKSPWFEFCSSQEQIFETVYIRT